MIPGLGKIPWRRERPPPPVFWPGEFHGLYMGSKRVGHDGATFTAPAATFLLPTKERNMVEGNGRNMGLV